MHGKPACSAGLGKRLGLQPVSSYQTCVDTNATDEQRWGDIEQRVRLRTSVFVVEVVVPVFELLI